MSKVVTSISESVKYFCKHLNLEKYLHEDPTGAVVWENMSGLRGRDQWQWGLTFKLEFFPPMDNIMEQTIINMRGVIDTLEASEWFKQKEAFWKKENQVLLENLNLVNARVKELEKYETHYNLQLKMQHGEKSV